MWRHLRSNIKKNKLYVVPEDTFNARNIAVKTNRIEVLCQLLTTIAELGFS